MLGIALRAQTHYSLVPFGCNKEPVAGLQPKRLSDLLGDNYLILAAHLRHLHGKTPPFLTFIFLLGIMAIRKAKGNAAESGYTEELLHEMQPVETFGLYH